MSACLDCCAIATGNGSNLCTDSLESSHGSCNANCG